MRNAKVWVAGAVLCAALLGMGIAATAPANLSAQPPGEAAQWRYHDGHWSYWHPGDKSWYYTDGAHWYYNNKDAWHVYNWDRGFGREGFERGTYKVPGTGVEVTVPRHGVYQR